MDERQTYCADPRCSNLPPHIQGLAPCVWATERDGFACHHCGRWTDYSWTMSWCRWCAVKAHATGLPFLAVAVPAALLWWLITGGWMDKSDG